MFPSETAIQGIPPFSDKASWRGENSETINPIAKIDPAQATDVEDFPSKACLIYQSWTLDV